MDQCDAKEKRPKDERKFSQEHYEILVRCSQKKDMTQWNQWRQEHPQQQILLQWARLTQAHLEGAHLSGAHLEGAFLLGAHVERAHLMEAHLEGAQLRAAHFEGAIFWGARLERAHLLEARLEGADLSGAHLEEAFLMGAHLEGAQLRAAHLEGAQLRAAHLEGARLRATHLEGAELGDAHLEGAVCRAAVVDGSTYLSGCTVDRNTDFREVGLDSARMEPGLKQLLKYNARRMNWEEWYERQRRFKRWPVHAFWRMSDYGQSTGRIIAVFFLLALIFAAVYYFWGLWTAHGIVDNLFVDRCGVKVPGPLVPIRAIYFSVVTMTTLGFGDMHAYAGSFWGHVLLMFQVLLGYVLLGALITRFAVLFQAEGPAGKFSPEYKGPKALDEVPGEAQSQVEE